MKLLIINGPNLNLLGIREPNIYGDGGYTALCAKIEDFAKKHGTQADIFQSNCEGALIDRIHAAVGEFDGIVINPGAYTHYSYALYDALKAAALPAVEVHISNIYAREEFRHKSVTAPACEGVISGLGAYGYIAAIEYFLDKGRGE